MATVVTVVGARPQIIKAAALSRALADREDLTEVLIHTGQHQDPEMSDVFFDQLGVPAPKHHLGIAGGSHGQMTGRMLEGLEQVLMDVDPNAVVVFGDTNSTLAGALAAAKLHIPVAHVEAGLRSFDRAMPEEVNRVVADHLSGLLLCPTTTAVKNLADEGITNGVHHVGDVMFDVALHAASTARSPHGPTPPPPYVVVTIHRAENTDDGDRLTAVIDYVRAHAGGATVVCPLHPRTRDALAWHHVDVSGWQIGPPLGYVEMTQLVRGAEAVFTDSGGLQKEAYFHRVPCVTLRDTTEWVETVDAGWNRLWTQGRYNEPRREIDEYGRGDAAVRIAELLASRFA